MGLILTPKKWDENCWIYQTENSNLACFTFIIFSLAGCWIVAVKKNVYSGLRKSMGFRVHVSSFRRTLRWYTALHRLKKSLIYFYFKVTFLRRTGLVKGWTKTYSVLLWLFHFQRNNVLNIGAP